MLVSRSFRHPQYAASGVPTVQGLQKVSDLGGEKLKTPAIDKVSLTSKTTICLLQ